MTYIQDTEKFKVGVRYRAEKQPDGNYTLYDIPIFSETKDKRKGRDIKYDAEWIRSAAKHHQELEAKSQHAPSLHYGHNESGAGERDKIGEVVNFRARPLNGRETIFVDVVDIEPEIYSKIQKGRLPHISVEIPDPSSPRIGSVAFLSSRAPYFTLPNILAEEVQAQKEYACYYSAESDRSEIVSTFLQEANMPKYQDEMPPEATAEEAPEEAAEPGASVEDRIADLEARVSALEEASSPPAEEAPAPIAEGGESEMAYGGNNHFAASVMQELKQMRKQLNTAFSYTRNLEKEKNVMAALKMAENAGKIFDSETFASQCAYYIDNASREVAQKAINDLIQALPRGTGLQGRQYFAGAQDGDAHTFSKDYIGDPEEYKVATEAAKQAMAMGEDDIPRWVRGEVNKLRYYKGKLFTTKGTK